MTRVAVLGTGIMGTGMAHSLARAGFDVTVWNRSQDKAEAVGEGTTVATSPAEAVKDADVVFTMLSNVGAVEDVANQFLEAMGPAVWCQSSTVGIDGTRRLAELATKHDVAYVECPVAGTKQPAEAGQLTVLAAGPDNVQARVQPAFDAIGARVKWMGTDPTQAAAAKLMMNSWVVGLTALLGETLTFARSYEIDPSVFLELIKDGPLDVQYAHMKGQMMIDRAYEPSFPLSLAAKDARLVGDAAGAKGVSLPINAGVTALFEKAKETHADADMAAVIEGLTAHSPLV